MDAWSKALKLRNAPAEFGQKVKGIQSSLFGQCVFKCIMGKHKLQISDERRSSSKQQSYQSSLRLVLNFVVYVVSISSGASGSLR